MLSVAALVSACQLAMSEGAFLDHPLSGVPRLGLGLAALGRPGYINLGRDKEFADLGEGRSREEMEKRCHEVLDAAFAQGVRYFDAARSYGDSEKFLSSWLAAKGLLRSEVVVGSKWGYRYTAEWRIATNGEPHEVKDHSLEHLETQAAESLGHLGHHLHLYQIHSATLESGVLDDEHVLARLRRLKTERGVRIGLSVSGPKQAAVIRKALEVSPPLFDAVQATYNLLEQAAGPALDEAATAGLQVIVKEAMANGRLLAPGDGAPAAVRELASKVGVSPDALCLAAVMQQPFQPMVLSGATTVDQVASNAGALGLVRSGALSQDALSELMAACCMDSEAYWGERSALQWN